MCRLSGHFELVLQAVTATTTPNTWSNDNDELSDSHRVLRFRVAFAARRCGVVEAKPAGWSRLRTSASRIHPYARGASGSQSYAVSNESSQRTAANMRAQLLATKCQTSRTGKPAKQRTGGDRTIGCCLPIGAIRWKKLGSHLIRCQTAGGDLNCCRAAISV